MLPSGRSSKKAESKTVIPAERHNIRAEMLSFAAENVIRRLKGAGFQAYVVGGAIRDLLLGIEPKDFDVATDATPEQVHKLFRRSRIVGRRFQIVHVMNGVETIEVTTFRGGAKVHQNARGRIMKDNTYGSIEEDAMRRDFTCNALYYDPEKEEILDFHNGIADVAARRLVMIGDAAERYREDPVRILRAIRLSGKLGFELSEETAAPIAESICRLKHEPVARLFDEIMKLLFSGHARECLKRLNGFDMPDDIHPLLNALRVSDGIAGKMTVLALKNTDERLRADKSVSVGFVLAALMWPELDRHWKSNLQQGLKPAPALSDAITTMRETVERGWACRNAFPPRCAKFGCSSRSLRTAKAHVRTNCLHRRVSVLPMISCSCAPKPAMRTAHLPSGGRRSDGIDGTAVGDDQKRSRRPTRKKRRTGEKTPPSQAQTQADGGSRRIRRDPRAAPFGRGFKKQTPPGIV